MVRVIQEPDSHTANDFTNNSQLHRLHHDQQLLPRSQINDSVLYFEGDEKTFRFKFQELSIESQDLIKTALVTILGDQVKPSNFMCLFLTVITGILFIFPFFFCCCQWWKRVISQIFIISEQTYHQIGQLIQYKNLSSVELKLFDNCFNKRKAQLISKSVKKRHTQLISLKITNLAGAFDFLKSEYSKFQQNMESMKSISGTSVSLEWYTKKLEYQ